MGGVSDLNDFPRSDDVTDPTICAWPVQEIAAAEAPLTAGTDRYMRAAAHAVARAALRELRQGPIVPGAAASGRSGPSAPMPVSPSRTSPPRARKASTATMASAPLRSSALSLR